MPQIKTKKIISNTIIYIILTVLGFFFLLPFFWMLSTSLKTDQQLFVFPQVWIPNPIQWSNYAGAVTTIPFFRYMLNTFFVAFMDVLGTVIACPLVAYGLSRIEWKGREILFFLTISVMMIPQEVTMIPQFIMFSKAGLVGTYVPLFIASFFGGRPFMIFLLRQFFVGLPKDLEDAARIDGASEFRIYRSVILPLVVPGILTVGLFRFMNSWNDFLGPLLYLNNESTYTLSIGLQMFTTQYQTEWAMLMAASLLVALPVIVMYFFVQKRFIQGITFTGIKG
jgi:multiple sugar transport system permease protein